MPSPFNANYSHPQDTIAAPYAQRPPIPSVVMVTPSFPSTRCGIATYTDYLVQSMSPSVCVSVAGSLLEIPPHQFLRRIDTAVADADLVHIQHAFDLYGFMGSLTPLLYRTVRRRAKRVVTTLHELPTYQDASCKTVLAKPYLRTIVRSIADSSDTLIVHNAATLHFLEAWGIRTPVEVIPHGSVAVSGTQKGRGPGAVPTIGCFGFIKEHKGIHRVLEVLVDLPEVHFVIAGEARSGADRAYLHALHTQVEQMGLGNRVTFRGFVPDEALAEFLTSLDVVVFPYSNCTASGILHLALAHGAVVLTSDLPVFQEIQSKYGCLDTFMRDEPATLLLQLRRLLQEKIHRQHLHAGCLRFQNATRWEVVAQRHAEIYTMLTGRKYTL